MSLPENQDPLDVLLREQNPYVADDGFTQRVVTSLPKRRAQLPRFFLLGAALLGGVMAALWLPWKDLPQLDASSIYSLNSQVLWPWAIVACVAASLMWAVIAAIQWED